MSRFLLSTLTGFLLGAAMACGAARATDTARVTIPDPALDSPLLAARGEQKLVLAGGCFWGVEAVFEHVKGVTDVKVGYSGGTAKTADYESVSTGKTGHAEAVEITYDPSRVTYGRLLKVFFAVAHDPTQLNRQGPDSGTQYRSAIFYSGEEQKRVALAYVTQLNGAKVFARPVATQVVGLESFYTAEAYHQDYAAHHPDESYNVIHDLPKVENLRKQFPELYTSK